MTRIAVLGAGPLQQEGVKFFSGQCLRTWHFSRPLLEAGHDVCLLTHPIDETAHDRATSAAPGALTSDAQFKGLRYTRLLTNAPDRILPEIERRFAEFSPDAIFGINPFPASLACRQRFRAPVWADMNGYTPAEGQTHCALLSSDADLEHFWRIEKEVVRRADRISTVSRLQRYATLGELAILGRLNRFTRDTPLAFYVPNAVSERFLNFSPPPARLKGHSIPADAFLLLWAGGFNTWTDIDVLHALLERALAAHPEFHFVATGGAIAGHDERTFARFRQLAAASPHAARCHLLGWVETEALDAFLGEADLGINIDSLNYETMFGARNRLTNMMACGLPVLTTRGTEISREIEEARVGLVAPIGDVEALAAHIDDSIQNRDRLHALGQRARKWALEEFSYERTTRDALEWAAKPQWAPDNAERLRHDTPELPLDRIPLNSLDELLLACDRDTLDRLRHAEHDLRAIRAKPLWKFLRKLRRLLKRE